MDNVKIFKEFWASNTSNLSKIYNRNLEGDELERSENLIYESMKECIKNTQLKTYNEFTSLELAEVTKIVDSFIKS
jgi:hypothetical protein